MNHPLSDLGISNLRDEHMHEEDSSTILVTLEHIYYDLTEGLTRRIDKHNTTHPTKPIIFDELFDTVADEYMFYEDLINIAGHRYNVKSDRTDVTTTKDSYTELFTAYTEQLGYSLVSPLGPYRRLSELTKICWHVAGSLIDELTINVPNGMVIQYSTLCRTHIALTYYPRNHEFVTFLSGTPIT